MSTSNSLDGEYQSGVSLSNEASASFASSSISSLTLPTVTSSVLRTDATGLVGGLNLAPSKRPRTSASGDDLDVADDITASEILTDGSGYAFVGPARVTGATEALSSLQISSGVSDYGRLVFGTAGTGGFYIQASGTALRIIRGLYGGSSTTMMTFTNAATPTFNVSATAAQGFVVGNGLYVSNTGRLEVQQVASGLRFRNAGTAAGYISITAGIPAAPRIASIPALSADDTFLFANQFQAPTFGALTCDYITTTGTTDNVLEYNTRIGPTGYLTLTRSTQQLRFRVGNTGNYLALSAANPAAGNRVATLPDPGAIDRTIVYTDLGQNVTFGDLTTTGTVILGDSPLDTLTVNATATVVGDMTIGSTAADTLTVESSVVLNGPLTISSLSIPTLTITTPTNGLLFTNGVDTVGFDVGVTNSGTIRFLTPNATTQTVLYEAQSQSFTLGSGSVNTLDITNTTGSPDLRILGSGLSTNLSEIYLGLDTWPSAGSETEQRIIAAGSGYGGLYANALIFRGLANGVIYDRMMMQTSPTSQTTYMAAPVGINVGAVSARTLNLLSSGTNTTLWSASGTSGVAIQAVGKTILNANTVTSGYFTSSALNAAYLHGGAWSLNTDHGDLGIKFHNNSSGTGANQFTQIRFEERGGGLLDRPILDLQAVRTTGATGEVALAVTGRDAGMASYTMRTSMVSGNAYCFMSPNTSTGWVGMLTQASPTAGYRFAVGPAATTATHSEFNGNLIVRGVVDAPLTISSTSNLTPAIDADITDPLRFGRILNASTDTSNFIGSGLSLRGGAATAVPYVVDLLGHRDGTQARGGFRVNVNDLSAASGWWTLMDLTPRLAIIRTNPSYGAGVGGLAIQGQYLPSTGYRTIIGNAPGAYDSSGAVEICGNVLSHGDLTIEGSTTLGNGTSDTTSVSGEFRTPLARILGSTSGAVSQYATREWSANQGCTKTTTAAATQRLVIRWRLDLASTTSYYPIQLEDHISIVHDAGLTTNFTASVSAGGVFTVTVGAAPAVGTVFTGALGTFTMSSLLTPTTFSIVEAWTFGAQAAAVYTYNVGAGDVHNSYTVTLKGGTPHSYVTMQQTCSYIGISVSTRFATGTLTAVSGTLYDLELTYIISGVSALYDTSFIVDSKLTARTSIVSDATQYAVTPTL